MELSKSIVTRKRKDEMDLHDISGEKAIELHDILDLERKDREDE